MQTIEEAINFVMGLTDYIVRTGINHKVLTVFKLVGQGDEVEEEICEEISLDSNPNYIIRRLESYLPV